MVALLKQKSKVQMAQKTRKSFPALDITKRIKKDSVSMMENVTTRKDPSQISSGSQKYK